MNRLPVLLLVLVALGASTPCRGHGTLGSRGPLPEPFPDLGFSFPPISQKSLPNKGTQPDGPDLEVGFISRTPTYSFYRVDYPNGIPRIAFSNQGKQRWPSPGETVQFHGRVLNQGTQPSGPFSYCWKIDDATIASGTHASLDAGASTTLNQSWVWTHTMDGDRVLDNHTVSLILDPEDAIFETFENNNTVVDRTNALSFNVVLNQTIYDSLKTPLLSGEPWSPEAWIQKQTTVMNQVFADSIYPLAPNGIEERIRIDNISIQNSRPARSDDYDGQWYFDYEPRIGNGNYNPTTGIDWGLIHEWGHQVGLIDLYNLDTPPEFNPLEDQHGFPNNFEFYWPNRGIMSGGDTSPHDSRFVFSSHSGVALNRGKGYRRGYYGEYLYSIPETNHLRILDNEGNPAPGVSVELYQR
ncbi:MAG: hypothetical protein KC931_21440, partial [Candidatus Omnitrophica bacterium]|nr:hypothetical protein [Candidatus Omnitrophota bacterium]